MYVIANRITVTGSTEDYEDIYRRGGEFMERQPGLIRHELVRSLRSPDVYFSLASWTDRESFERCAAQPVFHAEGADRDRPEPRRPSSRTVRGP